MLSPTSHLDHDRTTPCLLELEIRTMDGTVRQTDAQLSTRSGPALVSLPHIRVDLCRRIVGQTAVSGRDRLVSFILWNAGVAGDQRRRRRACRKDRKSEDHRRD